MHAPEATLIEIDIPGYRIIRSIGRGGMATVYLAIQENFQREVALKIMSPALLEDQEFSQRFLREASIVSRLMHPNIVTVHDVGMHQGLHYLAMEYIEGLDLKELLATLSARQLLAVVADVAKALNYAGGQGYVHRDVKPENIMLHKQDGRAVLMDFGIARTTDVASSVTRTGIAVGTPHYMSPEQARGQLVDGRSDLYSLGVLMYFLLLGKVPFDAESPVAIGIQHIAKPIPRLPQALASYQPIVDKLMAKKPEQRYQTGKQVHTDLIRLDPAPLARWRQQNPEAFSSLAIDAQATLRDNAMPLGGSGSAGHTPLRTKAAVLADASKGLIARVPTADKVPTAERVPPADKVPTIRDFVRPHEALHIPREDLMARASSVKRSRFPSMILLTALLSLLLLGGYYYPQWLPLLPDTAREQLIKIEDVLLAQLARIDIVITAPSEALNTRPDNETSAAPLPAVLPKELRANALDIDGNSRQIEALLDEAGTLASSTVPGAPQSAQLIALYRQVLALQSDHSAALRALDAIKERELTALEKLLAAGPIDGAQQRLERLVVGFPELTAQPRYQQLQQRLTTKLTIASQLQLADQLYRQDRLLSPANNNARQAYDAVLALDADNLAASQGLEKIAQRYMQLAQGASRKQDFNMAEQLLAKGLSVKPRHRGLLALRAKLAATLKKIKGITVLLAEAREYQRRELWFGVEGSAAQRYQMVLVIEPGHQQAQLELVGLLALFEQRIEQRIADQQLAQADRELAKAIQTLPGNDRLLSQLLELEAYRPVVEHVMLAAQAISEFSATAVTRVAVDRTLYIGFSYRNLPTETTVLQTQLFDGAHSLQIAAAPVVVIGREGTGQFRIDRPVQGFTEGGYYLDVLLNGKRILSHAFVIAR